MNFSVFGLGFLCISSLFFIPLDKSTAKENLYISSNKNQVKDEPPTVEYQDFLFQLTGCNPISSKSTKCNFIIENKKYDRDLIIYGKYGYRRTRLIDTSGTEAVASKVTIGRKTNRAYVALNLLRDVPINASIVFDGFVTDNIKVIDISAYDPDGKTRFKVKFQN